MKPYLYETHLHTSEGSKCGKLPAADQIRHYRSLGFTGVVVTDHFLNGNTTVPRELPWEERIDQYCRGYEIAREEGERVGLDVFFGFEFTWPHGTDFLVYGIDGDWLRANPGIMEQSLPDACDTFRAAGGVVIHAHPFREAKYIDMIRLLPRHVDGVETDNACRTDFENEMAKRYCEAYGLAPFSGSDNHRGELPRYAALASEVRFRSIGELTAAVLSRSVEQVSVPGTPAE